MSAQLHVKKKRKKKESAIYGAAKMPAFFSCLFLRFVSNAPAKTEPKMTSVVWKKRCNFIFISIFLAGGYMTF
jgi:hypothetical protein